MNKIWIYFLVSYFIGTMVHASSVEIVENYAKIKCDVKKYTGIKNRGLTQIGFSGKQFEIPLDVRTEVFTDDNVTTDVKIELVVNKDPSPSRVLLIMTSMKSDSLNNPILVTDLSDGNSSISREIQIPESITDHFTQYNIYCDNSL